MKQVATAFMIMLLVFVVGMASFKVMAWADDTYNVNLNNQGQDQAQDQAQGQDQSQGQSQANSLVNNQKYSVPLQAPGIRQTQLLEAPRTMSFWNNLSSMFLPVELTFEGPDRLDFRNKGSLKVKNFTPYLSRRQFQKFPRMKKVRLLREVPADATVIGILALRVTRSFSTSFAVSRAMQETYLHNGDAFVLIEIGSQDITTGHSAVHGGIPIPFAASRGALSSRLGPSGQRAQSRHETEPYVKGLIIRTIGNETLDVEKVEDMKTSRSSSRQRKRKRRPSTPPRMTWAEQRIAEMRARSRH